MIDYYKYLNPRIVDVRKFFLRLFEYYELIIFIVWLF